MGDQTLRIRAQAQLQGLVQYVEALKDARAEIRGLTEDSKAYEGTAKRAKEQSRADVSGFMRGRETQDLHLGEGEVTAHGKRGVLTQTSNDRRMERLGYNRVSGTSGEGSRYSKAGGGGGGVGGMAGKALGWGGGKMKAMGMMGVGTIAAGGAALGAMAIGGSLFGMITGAGRRYMELSKILMTVRKRFREAGENASFFGNSLGFTAAQGGRLAEQLGGQTNSVQKGTFQRYAGFARTFGQDPGQTMGSMGGLQQIMGHRVSKNMLTTMMGRAQQQGMGEGRWGEQQQGLTSIMGQMQSMGEGSNIYDAMNTQAVPSMIFGGGDARGQGTQGVDFMNRLSGVFKGSGAMRTTLFRAMGFGTEGGPDWIEASKRADAGVMGKRGMQNMVDMFGHMEKKGLGRFGMFRGIQSVAGGALNAEEIDQLSTFMSGTHDVQVGEGEDAMTVGLSGVSMMQRMMDTGSGNEDARAQALGSLSKKERAMFDKMGYLGSGKTGVSTGDAFAVQGEKLDMQFGPSVAEATLNLRTTMANMAESLQTLLPGVGDALVDVTGALRDVSAALNGKVTGPVKFTKEKEGGGTRWRTSAEVAQGVVSSIMSSGGSE